MKLCYVEAMLRSPPIVLLILSMFTSQIFAFSAEAQIRLDPGFDPNRVLEDSDIFDVNGMSEERLIRFLRIKGTLADVRAADIDGVQKTAAEIIWRVARSYKINPKYLLSDAKEQSLVEDRNPSQAQFDWATGYAICDACSKTIPRFRNSRDSHPTRMAAKQHRENIFFKFCERSHERARRDKPIVID